MNDNSAVYWMNGTMHNLEPDSRQAAAEGIVFAGSDMYVVGHVFNSADTAVQWKNGVHTSYSSDNGQDRVAYSVAVSAQMCTQQAVIIIRRFIGKMVL
ncbi:MAG: hypothetical protein WDM78_02820 [Puia sp.]